MECTISVGDIGDVRDLVLAFVSVGKIEEAKAIADQHSLTDQIPEFRESSESCECDICRGYALGEIEA